MVLIVNSGLKNELLLFYRVNKYKHYQPWWLSGLEGVSNSSRHSLSWHDSTEEELRTGKSNGHAGVGSVPAYALFQIYWINVTWIYLKRPVLAVSSQVLIN